MLDVYVLQQVVKLIFKFALKWQLQRPIQQEILWNSRGNSNINLPDIHVQHTLCVACFTCHIWSMRRGWFAVYWDFGLMMMTIRVEWCLGFQWPGSYSKDYCPNRQNLKYFWIWWKFRSLADFFEKKLVHTKS
jgi:hypothetical protein